MPPNEPRDAEYQRAAYEDLQDRIEAGYDDIFDPRERDISDWRAPLGPDD